MRELPARPSSTVQVPKPPELEVPKEPPKVQPDPVEELNIPAVAQASAAESAAGPHRRAQPRPATRLKDWARAVGPERAGGVVWSRHRFGSGSRQRRRHRRRRVPSGQRVTTPQLRSTPSSLSTRPEAMPRADPGPRSGWNASFSPRRVHRRPGRPVARSEPSGLFNEAVKAARQWSLQNRACAWGRAVPVLVNNRLDLRAR